MRVSFLGTDVRGIEFINCRWKLDGERRIRLFDEPKPDNADTTDSELGQATVLYRQLIANHEFTGDYSTAGGFRYADGARRRHALGPVGRRFSLLFFFWLFSGYGERYRRAVMWLVGLLLLSTLIFAFAPDMIGIRESRRGTTVVRGLDASSEAGRTSATSGGAARYFTGIERVRIAGKFVLRAASFSPSFPSARGGVVVPLCWQAEGMTFAIRFLAPLFIALMLPAIRRYVRGGPAIKSQRSH